MSPKSLLRLLASLNCPPTPELRYNAIAYRLLALHKCYACNENHGLCHVACLLLAPPGCTPTALILHHPFPTTILEALLTMNGVCLSGFEFVFIGLNNFGHVA